MNKWLGLLIQEGSYAKEGKYFSRCCRLEQTKALIVRHVKKALILSYP